MNEVEERVALGPVEVRVRYFSLLIAQMEQKSGDCVGCGGTLSPKIPVTADPNALDVQVGGEVH